MQLLHPTDIFVRIYLMSRDDLQLEIVWIQPYISTVKRFVNTICACYVTRYMFVVQVMSGWYYDQAKTIQCADMIFKINQHKKFFIVLVHCKKPGLSGGWWWCVGKTPHW